MQGPKQGGVDEVNICFLGGRGILDLPLPLACEVGFSRMRNNNKLVNISKLLRTS